MSLAPDGGQRQIFIQEGAYCRTLHAAAIYKKGHTAEHFMQQLFAEELYNDLTHMDSFSVFKSITHICLLHPTENDKVLSQPRS